MRLAGTPRFWVGEGTDEARLTCERSLGELGFALAASAGAADVTLEPAATVVPWRALADLHRRVEAEIAAAAERLFASLETRTVVDRAVGLLASALAADVDLLVRTPRALATLGEPAILDGEGDEAMRTAAAPGAGAVLVQPIPGGGLLVASRPPGERGFGEADLLRAALGAGHVATALRVQQLLGSVGHELANPTFAVLAHLEVAREMVAAGRPAELAEALTRAEDAARQILDMGQALRSPPR